jgi:hypothetical protein
LTPADSTGKDKWVCVGGEQYSPANFALSKPEQRKGLQRKGLLIGQLSNPAKMGQLFLPVKSIRILGGGAQEDPHRNE